MKQERIFKVLLGPHFSEKSAIVGDTNNQVVFKVTPDATKPEVKAAVEQLFKVKVAGVSVANVKGKTKRAKHGMGKRSDWKKAYVRLEQGQEIDFAVVE
jgi:large subunit ribosomal protein L23